MIKLNKIAKPQVLVDNDREWTGLYCKCLESGLIPDKELANKYNHPEIKAALENETHGKCAYCESKLKHISYGDIEHILPKRKDARPDLYVEWDNLTLACEQCNRSGKGTYYNPDLQLINPYMDNPEKHFQDLGPIIMPILGNDRAFVTEKVLKLNRSALVERRTDRIQHLEILLQAWANEHNDTKKVLLAEQICSEYAEDQEFSSTVRSFLISRGFPI